MNCDVNGQNWPAGKTPRIKFATPSMWWQAVKAEADRLPTYRGDWTDYWNFGGISSAREQAMNRASRQRLRTADALAAVTLGGPASSSVAQLARSVDRYRDSAWHHLHFWDEHTWGADQAIHQPYIEDTQAKWHHKAHYAYQARSLRLLLQRDGLATLAKQVTHSDPDSFLLFNVPRWPTCRRAGVARCATKVDANDKIVFHRRFKNRPIVAVAIEQGGTHRPKYLHKARMLAPVLDFFGCHHRYFTRRHDRRP